MTTALPDDLDPLEQALLTGIGALAPGTEARLDPLVAAECFEAQVTSRLLDHTARWLRTTRGAGYYTIGSAGHESNAAVALRAAADRSGTPALPLGWLLLRSRLRRFPATTPWGTCSGACSPAPPTRSRADGTRCSAITTSPSSPRPRPSPRTCRGPSVWPAASSIWRKESIPPGPPTRWWCAASATRRSTTRLRRVRSTGHRSPPMPDRRCRSCSCARTTVWVSACRARRDGSSGPSTDRSDLLVAHCDGDDPAGVYASGHRARRPGAKRALPRARCTCAPSASSATPAPTSRSAYRPPADVRADIDRDPILATARLLVGSGDSSPLELVEWYLEQRTTIRARALDVLEEPEHTSAASVMAPLAPPRADAIERSAAAMVVPDTAPDRQTLAQTINAALAGVLATSTRRPRLRRGRRPQGRGVRRHPRSPEPIRRSTGCSTPSSTNSRSSGSPSVRGSTACSPSPRSNTSPTCTTPRTSCEAKRPHWGSSPTVSTATRWWCAVAGYGYQKGFGGHFHNDNSIAVLRDIPGLVHRLAGPPLRRRPDAANLCRRGRDVDGAVCVFVEPIARYHTADLHSDGDGGWLASPDDDAHVPIGRRASTEPDPISPS